MCPAGSGPIGPMRLKSIRSLWHQADRTEEPMARTLALPRESSYAARTMYVFSGYTAVLALVLLTMAAPLARALELHEDTVPLLRLGGFIIGCSTVYYVIAARYELVPIMWATVGTRVLVPVVAAIAVVGDSASVALAFLASLDAAGGLWTWRALARSRRRDDRLAPQDLDIGYSTASTPRRVVYRNVKR